MHARTPIALVSLSHSPSLATRNLRRYCLAHEDVAPHVEFVLIDRDIREFLDSRTRSTQRLSFATAADEVLSSLQKVRPAIVAFSCYLWNTELSIRLASQVKLLVPDVQIVLGGPDVGPRATALLERHPEIDVIVDGDGEEPFLDLVRRRLGAQPAALADVPKITYRHGSTIAQSSAPPRESNLALLRNVFDDLPTSDELKR